MRVYKCDVCGNTGNGVGVPFFSFDSLEPLTKGGLLRAIRGCRADICKRCIPDYIIHAVERVEEQDPFGVECEQEAPDSN